MLAGISDIVLRALVKKGQLLAMQKIVDASGIPRTSDRGGIFIPPIPVPLRR